MKRHLLTLVLGGLVGSLVLAGDAQACHMKKCHHAAPTCAVVEPAPCPAPPPAPVCETACAPKVKKCGLFAGCFKGLKLGCHKKAACAPVCEPAPAPCATVAYSGPVTYTYSAPAVYSSPQGSAQH